MWLYFGGDEKPFESQTCRQPSGQLGRQRQCGMNAHTRRISHTVGITSGGRAIILFQIGTPKMTRRESSGSLGQFKATEFKNCTFGRPIRPARGRSAISREKSMSGPVSSK